MGQGDKPGGQGNGSGDAVPSLLVLKPKAATAAPASAAAVSVAAKSPAQPPPTTADGASPGKAFGGRREISGIRGIHESLLPPDKVAGTALRYVSSDGRFEFWRRLGFPAVGVAVLVALGALAISPHLREQAIDTIRRSRETLINLGRHRRVRGIGTDQGVRGGRADGDSSVAVSEVAQQRDGAKTASLDCTEALQLAVGSTALAARDRIAAADCYLAYEEPQRAESVLAAADRLWQPSQRDGTSKGGEAADLGDGLIVLVDAQLRLGKDRAVQDRLRGTCPRWQQSTACVARFMVQAQKGLGTEDTRALFESRGSLPPRQQAYLEVAGAVVAAAAGRTTIAEQRLARALSAAPPTAPGLRKAIYERQALLAMAAGQPAKAHAAAGAALTDLNTLTRGGAGVTTAGGLTKLRIIRDLTQPTDARDRRIRGLLGRNEVVTRARFDPDVVDLLAVEALATGAHDDLIHFLKRLEDRRFGSAAVGPASSSVRRSGQAAIGLWEVRAILAKGDADLALGRLDAFEHEGGGDVVSHHLRGVAYAAMGEQTSGGQTGYQEKYLALARQEFQVALRLRPNWESLYALGVMMIRTGHPDRVPPLLADLERQIQRLGKPGPVYWRDMLVAEWSIATGKMPAAQKLLSTWRTDAPERRTPLKLQVQAARKSRDGRELKQAQMVLTELSTRPRPETTRESLASPLGILALGPRPL